MAAKHEVLNMEVSDANRRLGGLENALDADQERGKKHASAVVNIVEDFDRQKARTDGAMDALSGEVQQAVVASQENERAIVEITADFSDQKEALNALMDMIEKTMTLDDANELIDELSGTVHERMTEQDARCGEIEERAQARPAPTRPRARLLESPEPAQGHGRG